jgi:CrcB protein
MHYALVFLGGGIGAALRHAVNLAVARLGYVFPVGTLAVNVLGSVLMGVLVAWFALRTGTHQHVKLLLTTGLLGGFTTFPPSASIPPCCGNAAPSPSWCFTPAARWCWR